MLSDLSDPLFILGTALATVLTYPAWPKITVKIERQACRGVQITDVAISITRGLARGNKTPSFEFSIYMIWKKRK
jgi:hypothetical protein